MTHRQTIEELVEQFAHHSNRGSLRASAKILPQIVHHLLDMIEGKPVAASTTPSEEPPPPKKTRKKVVAPDSNESPE